MNSRPSNGSRPSFIESAGVSEERLQLRNALRWPLALFHLLSCILIYVPAPRLRVESPDQHRARTDLGDEPLRVVDDLAVELSDVIEPDDRRLLPLKRG